MASAKRKKETKSQHKIWGKWCFVFEEKKKGKENCRLGWGVRSSLEDGADGHSYGHRSHGRGSVRWSCSCLLPDRPLIILLSFSPQCDSGILAQLLLSKSWVLGTGMWPDSAVWSGGSEGSGRDFLAPKVNEEGTDNSSLIVIWGHSHSGVSTILLSREKEGWARWLWGSPGSALLALWNDNFP